MNIAKRLENGEFAQRIQNMGKRMEFSKSFLPLLKFVLNLLYGL